jgi:hypothetical protein
MGSGSCCCRESTEVGGIDAGLEGVVTAYSEKDLESAILREIERFLLELGAGFCAGKKRETVAYHDLDARGIYVAEYMTELPPREVLEDRLHRAIEAARNRLVVSNPVERDVREGSGRVSRPGDSTYASAIF